jgi:hypothetical protein
MIARRLGADRQAARRRGSAAGGKAEGRRAKRVIASGGGAPRALKNADSRLRLPITAVSTLIAAVIGGSASVLACPICFGAEETALIDGTKLGIVVLLAITFVVQGGFVGFFIYLRRNAKRNAELELDSEWSELQRASRT